MSDLAVVIVTWNSAAEIADALRSLLADLRNSGLRHQVWVVDACSSDDTVEIVHERFVTVRLVESERNDGFGAANNLALRQIGFGSRRAAPELPQAVFLLNPDTVTHIGACRALYEALMSEEEIGVVGARLSFADGRFQHSAFGFPGLRQLWAELFPTPGRLIEGSFNGRYPRAWYMRDAPFDVDFTLGATMMLKRDVILGTGGFDEDFFLYCEEVDWAWRIKNSGWRILCVPSARVTHIGGGSTSKARPRSLVKLWKSRLLLYEKHYPAWKRWLARRLVREGMRRQLGSLPAADEELRQAYRQVVEMAKS